MLKDVLERAATELHDVESKVEALIEQIGEFPAVKQVLEAVQSDVEGLKTSFATLGDRLTAIEAGLAAVEEEFNAPAPAVAASAPVPTPDAAPVAAEPPATAAAPSAG